MLLHMMNFSVIPEYDDSASWFLTFLAFSHVDQLSLKLAEAARGIFGMGLNVFPHLFREELVPTFDGIGAVRIGSRQQPVFQPKFTRPFGISRVCGFTNT